MKYRSEIDGLRAVAVIPVILFHAGYEIFSGGFVGVDVFFVISGYLITTILINEFNAGTFNLVNFYKRRALRILPALVLVTLFCVPLAWLFLLPVQTVEFFQSVMSVATFSSNLLFWAQSGDYFDTSAELKPLLHTWSLAVEEQYYIIFPIILMLTWRFGRKIIIPLFIFLFCISLLAAELMVSQSPSTAFYWLHMRGWELLIGSFAAFILQKNTVLIPRVGAEILSLVGVLAIFVPIFVYDSKTPFPGLAALAPTLGTFCVILFASNGTAVHRLFSLKPLVFVGLISYSLYLWHQPLFAFARHWHIAELPASFSALLILAAFILAYFTRILVEVPIRYYSNYRFGKAYLCGALIAGLMVPVIGYIGMNSDGYPERFYALSPQFKDMRELRNNHWRNYTSFENVEGEMISEFPRAGADNVLVIGNSWGHDIAAGLAKIDGVSVAFENMSGHLCVEFTLPVLKKGQSDFQKWQERCTSNQKRFSNIPKNVSMVVLADSHFTLGQYDDEEVFSHFTKNLNILRENFGGTVVVIKGRPVWKAGGFELAVKAGGTTEGQNAHLQPYLSQNIETLRKTDAYYREFFTKQNVDYLSLINALCDTQGICSAFADNNILYFDTAHLTPDGAAFIAKYLKSELLN